MPLGHCFSKLKPDYKPNLLINGKDVYLSKKKRLHEIKSGILLSKFDLLIADKMLLELR